MWRSNQLSYRTPVWSEGLPLPSLIASLINNSKQQQQRSPERGNKGKKPAHERRRTGHFNYPHTLHSLGMPSRPFSRKEVFQPHLPVRLPCYDLAPITGFTLGRPSRSRTSGAPGFHGLTGGVYKAQERIHRAMADARLLANPASWGRVADPNPNYGAI